MSLSNVLATVDHFDVSGCVNARRAAFKLLSASIRNVASAMPLLSLVAGRDLACWRPLGVRPPGAHPWAPKGPKALLVEENGPGGLPVWLGLCGPVAHLLGS
jgi:hypothetical protein